MDRRLTIFRPTLVDDGTASVVGVPTEIAKRWAMKTEVSDGERTRAAQVGQNLTTRFVVRWDAVTRTIDGACTLTCNGLEYQVTGAKEVGGRRESIEITATSRPDQRP